MMRAELSWMTQTVFAGVVVAVVLTFILLDVITPSLESYGNEHAKITAQSIAAGINSLSRESKGSMYRELGLVWDVKIFNDGTGAYISVSHGDSESGDILLINDIDDFEAAGIGSIYIIKEPGNTKVKIQSEPPKGVEEGVTVISDEGLD